MRPQQMREKLAPPARMAVISPWFVSSVTTIATPTTVPTGSDHEMACGMW